jgi:hypothetical protein
MPSYIMIATANANAGQDDEFNTWYNAVHLKDGTKIEYRPGGVVGPKKVPLVC